MRSVISCWCSFRYGRASAMVMPSIPGAPLFALTLLYALLKLSLYSYRFQKSRLYTVSFFPYPIEWPRRFCIPFVFRTISLQTTIVFNVFCHKRSFLLSRSYSRLLLIRSFTSRLLWPLLTSVRSALLYAMVTSFKAYRTDLPRYHTFLPLHPSASSIMHDSV